MSNITFEEIDKIEKKCLRRVETTMNYEKDPNIQALLINDTYGSNLDREEMAELMDVMSRSRIKISKKAWYVYQEKYKNRK